MSMISRNSLTIITIIQSDAIKRICQEHYVETLYVFGSLLTERFSADSDVDLAVSFNEMPRSVYADNYFDLKHCLEQILGLPVDLVEYKAISNPYFLRNIDASKQLVYER